MIRIKNIISKYYNNAMKAQFFSVENAKNSWFTFMEVLVAFGKD